MTSYAVGEVVSMGLWGDATVVIVLSADFLEVQYTDGVLEDVELSRVSKLTSRRATKRPLRLMEQQSQLQNLAHYQKERPPVKTIKTQKKLEPTTKKPKLKSKPKQEAKTQEKPSKFKVSVQLEKGKSIVAQFQGSSKFYPGEIAKVLTDGDSYNVDNDNGDKAKNVTRMCIKPVEPVQPLKEGQVIVAKFGLTSRLHRGKIAKVLVNGLYNLAYFDGASEKNVARKFITPVDDSSEAEESPTKKKKAVAVKQDPSPRRARIIYRKQPANPPADVWASLVSDQPLPTKVKLCFECSKLPIEESDHLHLAWCFGCDKRATAAGTTRPEKVDKCRYFLSPAVADTK